MQSEAGISLVTSSSLYPVRWTPNISSNSSYLTRSQCHFWASSEIDGSVNILWHGFTRSSACAVLQWGELPSIQTSKHPNIQASKHPSIQTSKHPNIQTSKHPNIQASKHPSVQTSKHPDILVSKILVSGAVIFGYSIPPVPWHRCR